MSEKAMLEAIGALMPQIHAGGTVDLHWSPNIHPNYRFSVMLHGDFGCATGMGPTLVAAYESAAARISEKVRTLAEVVA